MLLDLRIVVRPQRAEALCQRLLTSGLVSELAAVECRGYGRQKGHLDQYQGGEYGIDFLPKALITGTIDASDRDKVVDLILTVARSGRIGDGKIFLVPIADTYEW